MTNSRRRGLDAADPSRLGNEKISKLLLRLALPAVTAQIVNVVYNIVDRIYIGRIPDIGSYALTGVGVVFPLIIVIVSFTNLVSMGGAPRASIFLGRNDRGTADRILGSSLLLLLIISAILTTVLLLFGRDILLLFGASIDTIVYASEYLNVYALGIVFMQLSMGLNAFLSAQGYASLSMLTILIGAIVNIVLDPVFIFGLNMGVRGAAIATVLSQLVSAIWVIYLLAGNTGVLKIRRCNIRLDRKIILPCLSLGISPFIMGFSGGMISTVYNISLQRYGGDIAVGAMTIINSAMMLYMVPLTGLTQGAQPIISYNYGAGNSLRVKKTFMLVLKTGIVYSAVVWAFYVFAPGIFVGAFTGDEVLADFASYHLRIFMASALLLCIQVVCQQTFVALGVARTSIFLAMLRKFVLLMPLIFILPLISENKTRAVFLAEPVADFIAALVTGVTFAISFKRILREMKSVKIDSAQSVNIIESNIL